MRSGRNLLPVCQLPAASLHMARDREEEVAAFARRVAPRLAGRFAGTRSNGHCRAAAAAVCVPRA